MSQMLAEALKHNTWATLRLLDACASLDAEQLAWSAPGTYGAIRDTLTHLSAAEQRYIRTLGGEVRPDMLRESQGFPGIDALREHARWSGERLARIAAESAADATVDHQYQGKAYKMRKLLVLMQAVDHGREHRTHATTVMSQHGVTPPLLDGWTYGEEKRLYWPVG